MLIEPTYIVAGQLQRDILLPADGQPQIDVPGGEPLYAAAGMMVWDKGVGVLARVGEDYPRDWFSIFKKKGLDVRGVRILPEPMDLRNFQAYDGQNKLQQNNPMAHFSRLGFPLPKVLLGFQPPAQTNQLQIKVADPSPRPVDIPSDYFDAKRVHLCGMEFPSASRLVSCFREANISTLTLDPQSNWMQPTRWNEITLILNGLSAFLPSEEDLRALFWGKTDDLVEMLKAIADQGCDLVVVKCGSRGQILFDGCSHKCWQIPAYPVQQVHPTGAGASFCGGFLAGYHLTYDPLQAVLHGNISASLTIEGVSVFHPLEAAPGLAKARLDSMKERVREI